mmetsp:Transcript_56781/g.68319  ORF Transcript_56781/g.68319 Transcript_56781/m.68319 type:complete len:526 (-) Transcript_56781:247-1824(-)
MLFQTPTIAIFLALLSAAAGAPSPLLSSTGVPTTFLPTTTKLVSIFNDATISTTSSTTGITAESNDGTTFLTSSTSSLDMISTLSTLGSGALILKNVRVSDVTGGSTGLVDTVHGRALTTVFESKLLSQFDANPQLLLIALEGSNSGIEEEDEEEQLVELVMEDVATVFENALAHARVMGDEEEFEGLTLEDLYTVKVVMVNSNEDDQKMLSMAANEQSETSSSLSENLTEAVTTAYTQSQTLASLRSTDTPTVTEGLITCDESLSRNSRASRAKLTGWKSRVLRGYTVDKFGTQASSLLARTLASYDRETIACAGTQQAGVYRMERRRVLQTRIENGLEELFTAQILVLEQTTLKKFKAVLLRNLKKDTTAEQGFDNNAAAVRASAFAFDQALSDLEITGMTTSLMKKEFFNTEMTTKLEAALLTFPDSPAAQISQLEKVEKTVNKKSKTPTQRSINFGLSLVGMLRPDGFGNVQGYTGYTLGPHSVTMGWQNDADSPDVMNQFGGMRPPLLRIQPKLNLDVEL